MRQKKIPAVFMRGGTSNAIVFHARDLPDDRGQWDAIFKAAMGSPDPNGRQLNGMGGGISSLSKVCVIGPPSRPDADIDYTFAQVSVGDDTVDYSSNCGNMSSAMGPFAVDEGLVAVGGKEALVRIHNTNTSKIIYSRFSLDDGMAAVDGDLVLPGVAGSGAPVRLEFLSPGGASTGRLLPTGNVVDQLNVKGVGEIAVSMVDASNACVFVTADSLGIEGTEMPVELDAMTDVMTKLESIRCAASVAMGIAPTIGEAHNNKPSIPKIGIVAPPKSSKTLSGEKVAASQCDVVGRMASMGNIHRALPQTGALCLAVAARIGGTLVHQVARKAANPDAELRILHPSGLNVVAAKVRDEKGNWDVEYASVLRTQRRMFEGLVCVPASVAPKFEEEQNAA